MNIALDLSPIESKDSVNHRVRGTGFYTKNLKEALLKYFPENKYTFFTRGNKLPKNTDLVHYPYFEPFFLTLPIFPSFPFVVTVHDLTPLVFPKNFPKGIKGDIKWQLQKGRLKKARRVIADSLSSGKDIARYAGIEEDKIDVVYLASDEKFKKKELSKEEVYKLRKKYNLPENFALYVGDVTWNKNLPRLVEASVKAKIPLAMVGKALVDKDFDVLNPWNQDLLKVQNLCEKNKNIIRIGFVEEDDLVGLYNIASVFIMPSLYEGFGLPVLEAMSCGCPVITSKEGSLSEVAGDAVCYIDATNLKDIENSLRKVFYEKNLQEELSRKGLLQSKKFSWKKTTDFTVETYRKALE